MKVLPLHVYLCSQAFLEILRLQARSGRDLVVKPGTSAPRLGLLLLYRLRELGASWCQCCDHLLGRPANGLADFPFPLLCEVEECSRSDCTWSAQARKIGRREGLTAEKCNKHHDEDDGDQSALGDLEVPAAGTRRPSVIVGTAIGTCVRCPSCVVASTGVGVASREREGRRRCRSHDFQEHTTKVVGYEIRKTVADGRRYKEMLVNPASGGEMWRRGLKELQLKESGGSEV